MGSKRYGTFKVVIPKESEITVDFRAVYNEQTRRFTENGELDRIDSEYERVDDFGDFYEEYLAAQNIEFDRFVFDGDSDLQFSWDIVDAYQEFLEDEKPWLEEDELSWLEGSIAEKCWKTLHDISKDMSVRLAGTMGDYNVSPRQEEAESFIVENGLSFNEEISW